MDEVARYRYAVALPRVRSLVRQADTAGFVAMGAPDDEYDVLVDRLIGRVLNGADLGADDLFDGWLLDERADAAASLRHGLVALQVELVGTP